MSSQPRASRDRGNFKAHEWKAIFGEIDKLHAEDDTVRVLFRGQELSQATMDRGRRHMKTRLKAAGGQLPKVPSRTRNLDQVRIERLDGNTWTLVKDFRARTIGTIQEISVPNQPLRPISRCDDVPHPDWTIDIGVNTMIDDANFFNLWAPVPSDLGVPPLNQIQNISGNTFQSLFDTPLDMVPNMIGMSPTTNFSFELSSFRGPNYSSFLSCLPSMQIQKGFQSRDTDLTFPITTMSPLFERTPQINFALFVADVAKCNLESERRVDKNPSQEQQNIIACLRNLATSIATAQSTCHDNLGEERIISPDELLQVDFNRILLTAVINGFANLESIPFGAIIAYLSRFGNIDSVLAQIFGAVSQHVKIALAENLFKAAIEAGNDFVVQRLLDTDLIDFNQAICINRGERYTPIERAAHLLHFRVVQTLLDAGADANKTLSANSLTGGALPGLVFACLNETAFETTALLESVRSLLQRYRVNPKLFQCDLWKAHEELVFLLASNISADDHAEALSMPGFFRMVSARLGDSKATHIIARTFRLCYQTGCGTCLQKYSYTVDEALIYAAKHGQVKLVYLFLEKHVPFSLNRLLTAAIRGGQEVLQLVLPLNPPLDGPANYIGFKTITTSLAEAIRSGDLDLRKQIEDHGGLSNLSEGGRLEAAILAATEVGDIALIRSLLEHQSHCKPPDLYKALHAAMMHNPIREDIVSLLLEAGANVNDGPGSHHLYPSPLVMAVVRKNPKVVRQILSNIEHSEFEMEYIGRGELHIISEIIDWGDLSVLRDLRLTFPSCSATHSDLDGIVATGNLSILRDLHQEGFISPEAWPSSLRTAIRNGNQTMLHTLFDLGAVPDKSHLTDAVAAQSEGILRLLLQRTHHSQGLIPLRFGTWALVNAISAGTAGSKLVDILLHSKKVDIHSCDSEYVDWITPLGQAIKDSENDQHQTFSTVRKLITAGCALNNLGASGHNYGPPEVMTSLMLAIKTGNLDLVQYLIEEGADIHTEAQFGRKRTPLQQAAGGSNINIVRLLLHKGANPNEPPATRNGGTAIQMAAISGDCAVAEALLTAGAKLDDPPPSTVQGRWPLEGAAEHGRLDMIEFLWLAASLQNVTFGPKMCSNAIKLARENSWCSCASRIEELQPQAQAQAQRNLLLPIGIE
ncbi:hypothetical protein F5Y16DRAFT_424827 [Xylariaceae sp. FL0255]|nr:hypothetical protein F5Y16DRAFT_424827 [Xylariaceae sp. FL0255]